MKKRMSLIIAVSVCLALPVSAQADCGCGCDNCTCNTETQTTTVSEAGDNIVSIGDTISVEKCFEITIEGFEIAENYSFENVGEYVSYSSSIEPSSGMKLVCLKGKLTNLSSTEIYPTNSQLKGEVVIDGNIYSATVKCVNVDEAQIEVGIVAQQTLGLYFYAEVPENVTDSFESCQINFGFDDELDIFTSQTTDVQDLDYNYTLYMDDTTEPVTE